MMINFPLCHIANNTHTHTYITLYLFYIDLVSNVPCQVASNGFRDGKVVGGTNALRGSIPYIASMTRRGIHFCG